MYHISYIALNKTLLYMIGMGICRKPYSILYGICVYVNMCALFLCKHTCMFLSVSTNVQCTPNDWGT